jgi:hypothetical protein
MGVIVLDPRAGIRMPITAYALKADTGKAGLRIALVSNAFYDRDQAAESR